METLFFTIVALFFLGVAVYYVFQRSKQGPLLPKKKQKSEVILPESQLYAGSDGAPTLEQALEEIQDEPGEKKSLSDNQTVQEPFSGNQDLANNQSEAPDMDLGGKINEDLDNKDLDEETDEDWDKEQETKQEL